MGIMAALGRELSGLARMELCAAMDRQGRNICTRIPTIPATMRATGTVLGDDIMRVGINYLFGPPGRQRPSLWPDDLEERGEQ